MAKIQPIVFPLNQGTATEMSVLILNHETTATTCKTYYQLKTEEGKVVQGDNYDLTEEEFAEEVEKFEGKSKLEQIKATEAIKAELTNAREAELAKFKPVAKETKLNPELQEKVTKFDTELENMLSNLDGKTINGVTFTPAVLNKIEETLAHGHISPDMYIDENGNFDAGEAIELAVLKHYRAAFINGLKGEYKSLGMKEALKQKHNVSSGKVKNTGMPDPTGNAAKRKADLDFMFPK